jgi:hypothetical protein
MWPIFEGMSRGKLSTIPKSSLHACFNAAILASSFARGQKLCQIKVGRVWATMKIDDNLLQNLNAHNSRR